MNTKKNTTERKVWTNKGGNFSVFICLQHYFCISLLVSNCFPAFVGPAWSAWGRGREFWTPTTSKLQLPCTAEKEEEFFESRERKDVQRKKKLFFFSKKTISEEAQWFSPSNSPCCCCWLFPSFVVIAPEFLPWASECVWTWKTRKNFNYSAPFAHT